MDEVFGQPRGEEPEAPCSRRSATTRTRTAQEGPLRAGILAALLLASPAQATPSFWDVARDPRVARDEQALVAVERMLVRAESSAFDPAMQKNFTRAGLALLELAGGRELRDPRLKLLLGELLIDSSARDAEGRELLERALEAAPDSPMAGRGWFNVAIASARLGDPARERQAYTFALEHVWDSDFRANIHLNRGESRMVLGDMKGALKDFRRAIAMAQRPDLMALAHYGLGIVLERHGDLPSALNAMDIARRIRMPFHASALDLPSVFFVPAYDLHYYKALSAMAWERSATSPAERRRALEEALAHWESYVAAAAADAPVWLPRARLHQERVKTALTKLPKELPKEAER